MKVDLRYVFLDNKKEPFREKDAFVTLHEVCTTALMANSKEEINGESKYKAYCIYKKLELKEIELTAEEISVIKKRVGEFYSPIIVGQAWDILEGKVVSDKKE